MDLIDLAEAWPDWTIWAERSLTPPGPAQWLARRNGQLSPPPPRTGWRWSWSSGSRAEPARPASCPPSCPSGPWLPE
jgi:hypothetical protein